MFRPAAFDRIFAASEIGPVGVLPNRLGVANDRLNPPLKDTDKRFGIIVPLPPKLKFWLRDAPFAGTIGLLPFRLLSAKL